MASVLRRFRRLSPPGAAMSGVAPPEDADAARASELAPVFATLDAVQREADALLEAARVEAEAIRAQAASAAETVIAGATEQAVHEKARASRLRLDRFVSEREALLERGRTQAAAIRAGGGAKAEAATAAVVERLRALAAGGVTDR
jgi:hypothetical protein